MAVRDDVYREKQVNLKLVEKDNGEYKFWWDKAQAPWFGKLFEQMILKPGDPAMLRIHQLREEARLKYKDGKYKRVIVVTDGVFSMRGDHAPLDLIAGLCREFDQQFPENVVLMVDDSHGVGAFGKTDFYSTLWLSVIPPCTYSSRQIKNYPN